MGIWRSVSEASPRARAPADLRANASAAAAAVLFGASVVAVRVAVRDVPPVSLAVLRFGLGGLLLAGILLVVAPRSLRARWERLPRFALLGLVLFVLFPLTFNVGSGTPRRRGVRSCWPRCRSGARSWAGSWVSA